MHGISFRPKLQVFGYGMKIHADIRCAVGSQFDNQIIVYFWIASKKLNTNTKNTNMALAFVWKLQYKP